MIFAGGMIPVIAMFNIVVCTIWLTARLIAPHDISRLEAVRIFLPGIFAGAICIRIGKKIGRATFPSTENKEANINLNRISKGRERPFENG